MSDGTAVVLRIDSEGVSIVSMAPEGDWRYGQIWTRPANREELERIRAYIDAVIGGMSRWRWSFNRGGPC